MNTKQTRRGYSLAPLVAGAMLCVLALSSGSALAQPGQEKAVSVSKVERKNRAPVSKEVLNVKLPKPQEAKLDNGLLVLIMEDHRFPTVSVRLDINGAGALYEPSSLPGLASAAATLIREGTRSRTSRQLAEDIDKLGATINASTGFGSTATVINASGLSDNFDEWFALLTDVLLNPTFPTEEVEKYKARQKVQLKQQRTQPSFLANERFSKALYGSHPAAVVSATEESINSLTTEALAKWHAERYAPQSAILGIAGDVNPNELIPKLKQWLAAWKTTTATEQLPPNPAPSSTKQIYLVDRPNSVQTTLTLGNLAIDRAHPDYIPLTVLNRIIGGGPAARLFLNLRENKGYTYGVYSNLNTGKYRGPWSASGDFRTDVTDGAMTELLYELKRIRTEDVPADELEETKRALVANFALSLEQPAQLLSYAITQKTYNFPADYWETYPSKLMAVTAADVKRMAQQYLNPDAMQVVAVGDGSKIKSVLEKYGPVVVYDTEGRMK
jgi:predicted Zn-dependent peptidase